MKPSQPVNLVKPSSTSFNVRLLTIALFLVFAANGAIGPNVSLYLEILGASYGQIALILTTHSLVLIGANYIWGRFSDRLGQRKPLVVGGLFGLCISLMLMALAPSYQMAWWAWLLKALALAAYNTTSLAFLGDLLARSQTRGRQMGSYRSFASLSFALGAFGGGPIIDFIGLEYVYGIGAILCLGGGLATVIIREPISVDTPSDTSSQNKVNKSSTVAEEVSTQSEERLPLFFLLGITMWSFAFSAAYSMWPNFLAHLGYPKSAANWLWGVAALCEVPFMSVAGWLADYIGRTSVLSIGGIGMGLVLMGYVFFNAWLIGLIGTQIWRGFAYSASNATAMLYATEVGSNRTRAGTVGLYHSALGVGQILGLAIGGPIVEQTSFETLFLISTGIFVISGVMFLGIKK